jgi:hypothetical protein
MPGSKGPERLAAERRPERCRRTQPALPRRPASRPPDSRTGRAGSHQSRLRYRNHTGKSRSQIRCRRSPDRRSRGHRTRVPERSPSWHTRASHKERQEPKSAAPCRNPLRRRAESRRPGHVRLHARRAEVADLAHDKTYAYPERCTASQIVGSSGVVHETRCCWCAEISTLAPGRYPKLSEITRGCEGSMGGHDAHQPRPAAPRDALHRL